MKKHRKIEMEQIEEVSDLRIIQDRITVFLIFPSASSGENQLNIPFNNIFLPGKSSISLKVAEFFSEEGAIEIGHSSPIIFFNEEAEIKDIEIENMGKLLEFLSEKEPKSKHMKDLQKIINSNYENIFLNSGVKKDAYGKNTRKI